MTLRS